MARQTTVNVPANAWTQITDADVTAITFQNVSGYAVRIRATNGTSAPTDQAGALTYGPGQGERNVLLADLSPGVAGANRVWAFSELPVSVAVSHA
jgi:hypothetical protein